MLPKPFTYNDPLNTLYSCTVTPFQPDNLTLQWHWAVQRTDTGKILEQSSIPLPSKTDALARGLGAMTRCIIHRRS